MRSYRDYLDDRKLPRGPWIVDGPRLGVAYRDSRSKPDRAETGTGSVHESDGARSAIARNPLKLRAV